MSAAGLSVFGTTIRISVRAKAHVSNRAFGLEIDVFYLIPHGILLISALELDRA